MKVAPNPSRAVQNGAMGALRMAKHKFKKPPKDMDENKAVALARADGKTGSLARLALAAKGKDLPGPVKSKTPESRMKSRYGAR